MAGSKRSRPSEDPPPQRQVRPRSSAQAQSLPTPDNALSEADWKLTLQARQALWGDAHPDLVPTLDVLADLYRALGDPAAAEPLYRQALAIQQVTPGEGHRGLVATLNNLADLCKARGDPAVRG